MGGISEEAQWEALLIIPAAAEAGQFGCRIHNQVPFVSVLRSCDLLVVKELLLHCMYHVRSPLGQGSY